MKTYKIYLSGKIAGLTPDSVLANFAQAKRDAFYRANQEGAEWNEIMIVDPSALPKVQKSWADYIIRDLMLLKECTHIALMPNWRESPGAEVELAFAKGAGIKIWEL